MKKRKGGRPSKYETKWKDKLIVIQGWAREGLIDEQIAENMGIATSTFYEWKKRYPEFAESLQTSKDVADYHVENALYETALSGNVTAMIFWLKNRRPDKWRDKQEVEQHNTGDIKIVIEGV